MTASPALGATVAPAVQPFVHERVLGDLRAVVVSTGTFAMQPRPYAAGGPQLFPHTALDAAGRTSGGLNSMLLIADDVRIVIDPGYFAVGEVTMLPELEVTDGLDGALARLRLDPADIDFVIVTHGHFDHCSGVPRDHGDRPQLRFPNAIHLIHHDDWDPARGLRAEWRPFLDAYLGPADAAGRLRTFSGAEHRVAPEVTLLHAPGETPGHCVVRILSAGEQLYYLGDLIHLPGEAMQVDWAAGTHERDVDKMAESRRRVLAEVSSRAAPAIFTHAQFPGLGTFEAVGEGSWLWRYDAEVPDARRKDGDS